MIWMAAASDMMVHSVLQDKVWTSYHGNLDNQRDGLTLGEEEVNYSY